MDFEILCQPSNTVCRVDLQAQEVLTAQSGAMVAMSSDIDVETSTYRKGQRGIKKALKRVLAGESFFLNHFTAKTSGEVWLAPVLPGDMQILNVSENQPLIIQSGCFLGSSTGVEVDLKWQGIKSLAAGEIFWLKVTGSGHVIVSAFGSLYKAGSSLGDGNARDGFGEGRANGVSRIDGVTIDSGHVVAFSALTDFKIVKTSRSWVSSFLSGEGIGLGFAGNQSVLCQSHSSSQFGKQLGRIFPARKE